MLFFLNWPMARFQRSGCCHSSRVLWESLTSPGGKHKCVDTDSYRELVDHHLVTLVVWLADWLFLNTPRIAAGFCLFGQCEYEQQDYQVDMRPGRTVFRRHFPDQCLVLFLGPKENELFWGHMNTAKFLRHLSPNFLNWTILKGLLHEELEQIKHEDKPCLASPRLHVVPEDHDIHGQACHSCGIFIPHTHGSYILKYEQTKSKYTTV